MMAICVILGRGVSLIVGRPVHRRCCVVFAVWVGHSGGSRSSVDIYMHSMSEPCDEDAQAYQDAEQQINHAHRSLGQDAFPFRRLTHG